jgi:hypothetical protein
LSQFLSDGPAPHDILLAVVRLVAPDAVPNDYGKDSWLIALGNQPAKMPNDAFVYLRTFALTRTLGWRSRNEAELAQYGFRGVYNALSYDCLPDDAWHLEMRLPWVMPWLNWDRCLRVRNAGTDIFVDRDLSAAQFAALTDDDQVFSDLVSAIARTYRGWRYLSYLRNELEKIRAPKGGPRI